MYLLLMFLFLKKQREMVLSIIFSSYPKESKDDKIFKSNQEMIVL